MDILGDQSPGRPVAHSRSLKAFVPPPERLCASTSCTPRFLDGVGGEFAAGPTKMSDYGPPPSAPQPPKPPSTPLSPSPSTKLQEVRRILQQEELVAKRRQSCPAYPDSHLCLGARASASARVSTDFAPEAAAGAPDPAVYVVRRAYRSSLDGSQPSSANSTAPGEAPGAALSWAFASGHGAVIGTAAHSPHSGGATPRSAGRAPSVGPSPLPSRRGLQQQHRSRSGSRMPTVGMSAPGSLTVPPPPPTAVIGLGSVPLAKLPGTASLPKPPPQEGVHLHSSSPREGGPPDADAAATSTPGQAGGSVSSSGGMMATRPPRPSRFKSSNGLLVSSIAPPPALASCPLHFTASGPLFGGHGLGSHVGHHSHPNTIAGVIVGAGGGFTSASQSTSAAVSPPHTPRGRGSGNGDWPPLACAPAYHSHTGSPFRDGGHDADPESLPSPFSDLHTSSQIFSSVLCAGSMNGRGPTRLFAHDPDGLPISDAAPRGPMAISETGAATGSLAAPGSAALAAAGKSGAASAAAASAAARPQPPGLGLVTGLVACRLLMFLYYTAVLVVEVEAWRNHSIRQSASARLRRLEEEEEEEGFWHYGARSGAARRGPGGLLGSIQGWIRAGLSVLDPGGSGPLAAAFPLMHAALAAPCLLALLVGVWWEPAALLLGGRFLADLAQRHGWALLMFYKGESAQLMRMKELGVIGATLVAAARSIPAAATGGGSSSSNSSSNGDLKSGSSTAARSRGDSNGPSRTDSSASLSVAAAASARAAAAAAAAADNGYTSGPDAGGATPKLSPPLARGNHASSTGAAWPQQRRSSVAEAHARDIRRHSWRQDSPTPGAGGYLAATSLTATPTHSPPPHAIGSGHKLPAPPPSLSRSPPTRAPASHLDANDTSYLGAGEPLPDHDLDPEELEEDDLPRGRSGRGSGQQQQQQRGRGRGQRGTRDGRRGLGGVAGALVAARWALLHGGLGLMAPLFLYYGCVQVEHVRDMQDGGGVGGALRELVADTYRWVPPGDGSLNTFWLPSQFALALPYFTGMGPQWLAVALAGAVGMEGLLCWRFWARGGMLWTYAFYVARHFLANAVIAAGVLLSLPAAQVQAPARAAALWRRKSKDT